MGQVQAVGKRQRCDQRGKRNSYLSLVRCGKICVRVQDLGTGVVHELASHVRDGLTCGPYSPNDRLRTTHEHTTCLWCAAEKRKDERVDQWG